MRAIVRENREFMPFVCGRNGIIAQRQLGEQGNDRDPEMGIILYYSYRYLQQGGGSTLQVPQISKIIFYFSSVFSLNRVVKDKIHMRKTGNVMDPS